MNTTTKPDKGHQTNFGWQPPQPTNENIKGRKTSIVPRGALAQYLDLVESMGMDRSKGLVQLATIGLNTLFNQKGVE